MTSLSRAEQAASNTRADIMAAIATMQDPNQRAVLMLLLKVLDDIGAKIDAVLADENKLREMVLNGHSEQHDEHHVWVQRQIIHDEDHLRHHRWVQEHIEHGCDDVCAWARTKMAEEKENSASRRRVFEGWASEIGRHIITILLTIFGLGLYAYFS